MGFLICCDNKKCGKTSEALLDSKTNDVYCAECGDIIKSVTSFTKSSMRTMSQFKKTIKSKSAFSVVCTNCTKENTPKLNNKLLICPSCGVEYKNIQPLYAHSIKVHLGQK